MANTHNSNQAYGGIISALQAVTLVNNKPIKGYPENYDGIISAILDLGKIGDAGTGEYPPGWNESEGIWERPPNNGDLWFDKRQGRLMVYVDDDYYQANGADQLTAVGETAPDDEVLGAFWYNPTTGTLFIYDGTAWVAVVTATGFNTGSLPLSVSTQADASARNAENNIVTPFTTQNTPHQSDLNRWIINALNQLDANATELDSRNTIAYSDIAPNNPNQGDLWYNTSSNYLQVYSGSAWLATTDLTQTSVDIQTLQANRVTDNEAHLTRNALVNTRIDNLPLSDYALQTNVDSSINGLTASLNALSTEVGNVDRFALAADTSTATNALDVRLTTLENNPVDLTPYAETTEVESGIQALRTEVAVSNYATESWVNQAIAAINIPDISTKVNTADFDTYKAEADQKYFPKAGGELTGTFLMNKMDIAYPSFDFSSSTASGEKIFKILPFNGGTNAAEFGTNTRPWEIAWDFSSNTDFCYKHSTAGKVLSINKDGVTAKELRIADFGENNSNGQVANHVIDVKAKLNSHDTSIAALQTAVNNLNQTTEPKVFYSATAPATARSGSLWFDTSSLSLKVRHANNWVKEDATDNSAIEASITSLQDQIDALPTEGAAAVTVSDTAPSTASNGDLWFDSVDVRLLVRYNNAWINPDRVEDTDLTEEFTELKTLNSNEHVALQASINSLQTQVNALSVQDDSSLRSDLLSAVTASTSYLDLKARLMAALSA